MYRNLMQLEVHNFKNEILNGEKYKPYDKKVGQSL